MVSYVGGQCSTIPIELKTLPVIKMGPKKPTDDLIGPGEAKIITRGVVGTQYVDSGIALAGIVPVGLERYNGNIRAFLMHFHEATDVSVALGMLFGFLSPNSRFDLFLFGGNYGRSEKKINEIYSYLVRIKAQGNYFLYFTEQSLMERRGNMTAIGIDADYGQIVHVNPNYTKGIDTIDHHRAICFRTH